MKSLNDIIAEVQALLADLQAIADAPAATPAQQTVVEETITLSDGSVIKFENGAWSAPASTDATTDQVAQ